MTPSNHSSFFAIVDHSLWRCHRVYWISLSLGTEEPSFRVAPLRSWWSSTSKGKFQDEGFGEKFSNNLQRDATGNGSKLNDLKTKMFDSCHIISRTQAVCPWVLQKIFGQRLPDLSLLYIHSSFGMPKKLSAWTLLKPLGFRKSITIVQSTSI